MKHPLARIDKRGAAAALATVLLLTCWSLAGCVVVKPYQRERLTERSMTPGFGDKLDVKFRGHWEGARLGTEGGFCAAAGGCGCN